MVAPGVIPYVKKSQAAFRTIIDNPVGFVGNLVRAGRLGVTAFVLALSERMVPVQGLEPRTPRI